MDAIAHRYPLQDGSANPSTASLFIVNPFRATGFAGMFRTHPSTAERIKRLRAMTF
jgi:heat shock protein HtpX